MYDSSWQSFWQNAIEHDKRDSGINDAGIARFWSDTLPALLPGDSGRPLQVLEIGAGDGALTSQLTATTQAMSIPPQVTSLDIAEAALVRLRDSIPGINTLCADAGNTGLEDGSFDLVISQFGVEYAGQPGFREAARLLAPGGSLCLVLHRRGSAIDEESRATSEALARVLDSGMLKALSQLSAQSTALRRGEGSRVGFELADRELAPTVQAVEQVLRDAGREVAAGLVFRLYGDVAHMYRGIHNYDAQDIEAWVDTAGRELRAFRERALSMSAAALDHDTLDTAAGILGQAGLQVTRRDELDAADSSRPWILQAQRPS